MKETSVLSLVTAKRTNENGLSQINWVKLWHVDENEGIAKGSDHVCVITAQDQRGSRDFNT